MAENYNLLEIRGHLACQHMYIVIISKQWETLWLQTYNSIIILVYAAHFESYYAYEKKFWLLFFLQFQYI
jgi:hypothetical protein